MKQKLLILFVPIALSIFGIIYFQIDWMIKTYDIEFKKINTIADDALKLTLTKYNQESQDSLTRLLIPKLSLLCDTVALKFSNDSLIVDLEYQHTPPLDPLENPVARLGVGYGKIHVNFPSHNIYENKNLMTKTDRKAIRDYSLIQKQVGEIFPPFSNSCEPLYFKADSSKISDYFKANLSKMGMSDMNNLVQLVFYCKQQAPLELPLSLGTSLMKYRPQGLEGYSNNNRWVGAYFHNHNHKIISQMIGRSGLSVILILIMIFCFIYLARLILKQKRLAEMKDTFINNMTHELKTPIATISAAIEGMQSFKVLEDKEKTQRYLNTSRSELLRLNAMVTKVLDISTYERNDIEMIIQEVNLLSLIQDVISTEKLKAGKEIKFNLDIRDSAIIIKVDPSHFRNVLTNLIDNAIKYSNESVEIDITCFKDESFIYLKVKDNGIGISSLQLKQVFDKFYRVSTGNVHNVKGSGLGLYYVKYIIDRHQGSISVQSEINKGSEFTISIPIT